VPSKQKRQLTAALLWAVGFLLNFLTTLGIYPLLVGGMGLPSWVGVYGSAASFLVMTLSLASIVAATSGLVERRPMYVRPHWRSGGWVRGHWRRAPSSGEFGWFAMSQRALRRGLCVGLLVLGLVGRVRYGRGLAERLIGWAIRWLPEPYREHYQAEWLAELDWLRARERPVLGWAGGVLSTAAMTRLALRARLERAAGRVRSWPVSPAARVLGRHKPLGLGLVTAAGVFCAAAVEWSGARQGPSRAQVLWALAASVLTGAGVVWQAWPRGPVPGEHGRVGDPDSPVRR
jgi:hypothetical protein